MRTFLERLKSRKLIMALLAALIAGLKVYFPDLPEDSVNTVVLALMGYVAVEGAVDAAAALAKWVALKSAGSDATTKQSQDAAANQINGEKYSSLG